MTKKSFLTNFMKPRQSLSEYPRVAIKFKKLKDRDVRCLTTDHRMAGKCCAVESKELSVPSGVMTHWVKKTVKGIIVLLILLGLCQLVHADARRMSSRVVTTKYGALRGFINTLSNRHLQPVEVFLGVPYAGVPVGSLRFLPPVTPPHWRGVRMADHFGSVCPQRLPDISNETESLKRMPAGRLEYLRRLLPFLVNQSEDCLYLNIYTPAIVHPRRQEKFVRESVKLPVLVFIHGESYQWNSGNPYDGSVISSFGNIVVVTINYRLGVLGFLPALDGSSRGNYGLMDQVAALHWIQENIEEFGGDGKNVTVFGHGHGAACVNLLMLSPLARGLFQRAIMQSGSALSPWAIARDALTYTRHMAKELGCPTEENAGLVECMRKRPVAEIMRVHLRVPEHLTSFGPTIDGIVVPNEPATLMEKYSELYGQYHLLFGVTRIESYFHFSAHEDRMGIEIYRRDRLMRTLVRNLFVYHLQEIFLTIVNEYTDWTKPDQHPINVLDSTADALGDALVVAPIIRAGNYHSKVPSRTFFYVFTYQSEEADYSQRMGCIHGEDLSYVFGAPLVASLAHFSRNYTRSEGSLSEGVMTYWTNFVKFGDPNIPAVEAESSSDKGRGRFEKFVWPQYDVVHQKYVSIGMKPKVRDHYHAHRLSFWLHLIPTLHRSGATDVSPRHHLLEDHDNPLTYDGIVRQVPWKDPSSIATTPPPSSGDKLLTTLSAIGNLSEAVGPMLPTERGAGEDDVTVSPASNITDSLAIIMQHGAYSTALSVTIAIGCSLLILNVLIFAGVYYQRDKNKSDNQKRGFQHCDQFRTADGGPGGTPCQSKQLQLMATLPSPMDLTSQNPNFVSLTPAISQMDALPNKIPPKLMVMPPQENSLPEAQPLLPHTAVRPVPQNWPPTQEMRV